MSWSVKVVGDKKAVIESINKQQYGIPASLKTHIADSINSLNVPDGRGVLVITDGHHWDGAASHKLDIAIVDVLVDDIDGGDASTGSIPKHKSKSS